MGGKSFGRGLGRSPSGLKSLRVVTTHAKYYLFLDLPFASFYIPTGSGQTFKSPSHVDKIWKIEANRNKKSFFHVLFTLAKFL